MERTTILALPRSGTTSIFSILENLGSRNEYMEEKSIELFSSYRLNNNDTDSDELIIEHVMKRWMLSKMTVDAASFNFMCPNHIHKVYPNMRYIYLLREPASWIESFVSMLMYYRTIFGNQEMPKWMTDYGKVYSLTFDWEKLYECTLENRTPYAEDFINELINFWCLEHSRLLTFCRGKNILYLETNMISNSLDRLAKFLEVDASLFSNKTHANKGKDKKYFLTIAEHKYIIESTKHILENFSAVKDKQNQ